MSSCHYDTYLYKGGVSLVIMRKFSPRKINKVCELRKLGYSVRKIADELKCSPTTVQKYTTEDRNYEMIHLNLFPEGNFVQKMYAPASSQPTQGSYQSQVHHYYLIPQNTSIYEQHRQYIDQENEQIDSLWEELKQMEKSEQSFNEKISQLKQEISAWERKKQQQENNKLQKKIRQTRDEIYKERRKSQELKINQGQETQQKNNSSPTQEQIQFIRLKAVPQKIESQKKEELITNQAPLQQKQVEVKESPEKDYAPMIEGLALGGIQILCKISNFLNSPESKIPITSLEFWRRWNKYLTDDNKKET